MIQNIKNSFRLYKRVLKVYMPKTAVPSFIRLRPNVFPGFKLKKKNKNQTLNWIQVGVFHESILQALLQIWDCSDEKSFQSSCCLYYADFGTSPVSLCSRQVPHKSWDFFQYSACFFCHRLKSFKRKTNACLRTVTVESFELGVKHFFLLLYLQVASYKCALKVTYAQLLYYCHWPIKQAEGSCVWQQRIVVSNWHQVGLNFISPFKQLKCIFIFKSPAVVLYPLKWNGLKLFHCPPPHSTFVFCSQQLLLGNTSCLHAYIRIV